MDLATLIPIVLRGSIILTVFCLGLEASSASATYFLHKPGQLVRSLLSMNIVMPIIATVLAIAFDLHPAVRIALVTLAVSPVPPMFPKKAKESGGEEAYAIGLLVAAAVFSIVFVPFAINLLGKVFQVPAHMSSTAVSKLVLITILAPLGAGMLLRQIAPELVQRTVRPLSLLATVLLIAAVVPILLTALPAIWSLIGNYSIMALTAFIVAGLTSGHLLGGPTAETRTVLALSSASRHPALALAIANENFPQQKLAFAAVLLYLLLSLVVSKLYLTWSRGHSVSVHDSHTDLLRRSA